MDSGLIVAAMNVHLIEDGELDAEDEGRERGTEALEQIMWKNANLREN